MNEFHGHKRKRLTEEPDHTYSDRDRDSAWRGRARGARSQKSWAHSDQARLNELQEADRHREFLSKEGQFVLQQKRKAADIRIREGRARSMDWLILNLRLIDPLEDLINDDVAEEELEFANPEAVIESLPKDKLADTKAQIREILALEQKPRNREYWRTLLTLCEYQQNGVNGRAVDSVSTDIAALLTPKSYPELEKLEKQIRAKLDTDEPIDTDYWQQLLDHLMVYKAKAKVKHLYDAMTEARRTEYRLLNVRKAVQAKQDLSPDHTSAYKSTCPTNEPLLEIASSDKNLNVVDESQFLQQIDQERHNVRRASFVPAKRAKGSMHGLDGLDRDMDTSASSYFDQEVAKGVEEDEEVFTGEEHVTSSHGDQRSGKSRPRKPRYFNRVQMGYEWNKYNQTHYDHDNPPPKVVQGYKFHLFYPDLVDTTKAPTYKILREGGRKKNESVAPAGEEDTCIIHFIAGPPYKDVAFRIVDREWDFSAKNDRGFKSTFENGILTLHFSFRKVYYRK